MPRNVDGPDAAGQQIIPDGTIGLPTSSVTSVQQPGNMASGQGLNAQQQSECHPYKIVQYIILTLGSDWVQRVDWWTKPVSGHAHVSPFLHVQCTRGH